MSKKNADKKGRKPQGFEAEDRLAADEAAVYLERIAQGLRDGAIVLGEDEAAFRAAVGSKVDLEVRARSRKKKSRIKLRLNFRNPDVEKKQRDADDEAEAASEAEQEKATIPDVMTF